MQYISDEVTSENEVNVQVRKSLAILQGSDRSILDVVPYLSQG